MSSKLKNDILNNISPMPLTYHIVLYSHSGKPLFQAGNNSDSLAYLIFETSILHTYNLFAFCIMPDHVHILCQPGDVLISHFTKLLRFRYEFMLRKAGHKGDVWQSEYMERTLTDDELVSTAVFILENPVRNGIAKSAIEYPFSFVVGGKDYKP